MLAKVRPQQLLIEGCSRFLGARMGMRVDEARQQPALARELGSGDRVGRPPVAVGVEVGEVAIWQCISAYAQDSQQNLLDTAPGRPGGSD
jgi:hypothetical protein